MIHRISIYDLDMKLIKNLKYQRNKYNLYKRERCQIIVNNLKFMV